MSKPTKKNLTKSAVLTIAAACCFSASNAQAQASTGFTYQGQLSEAGSPADGAYPMTFRLFDASVGGAQIGPSIVVAQTVTDGLFDTPLDFGAVDFGSDQFWLEIIVDGTTLTPRQAVSGSPYAVQTRGIFVDTVGNVGIGINTPLFPLHVESLNAASVIRGDQTSLTGSVTGVRGNTASSAGIGVHGESTSVSGSTRGGFFVNSSNTGGGVEGRAVGASGPTYGVLGVSLSSSGRGVLGNASSFTGTTTGVYGTAASPSGTGVVGIHISATGTTPGVRGDSVSNDGFAVGVHGRITSTLPGGFSTAVRGENRGTGTLGIGVWGSQAGSGWGVLGESLGFAGSGIGVRGVSNSPTGSDFFADGPGVNYAASSSIRWKSDVVNIDHPLAKLASLRGVYYTWDQAHGGHHDMGMIAEEVGKVLPEIVAYEENGVDAKGLDYSKLTPLLVEATNALRAEKDAQIEMLERANAEVSLELAEIRRQNQTLQARLHRVELLLNEIAARQASE